jgi:hypothetical protein
MIPGLICVYLPQPASTVSHETQGIHYLESSPEGSCVREPLPLPPGALGRVERVERGERVRSLPTSTSSRLGLMYDSIPQSNATSLRVHTWSGARRYRRYGFSQHSEDVCQELIHKDPVYS